MQFYQKPSDNINSSLPRKKFRRRLLDNGLFWMAVILMGIGGITNLYCEDLIVRSTGSKAAALAPYLTTSAPATGGKNHQVKDRKLPIYCVQTDEPRVALSFDAAWGNEDTRQLLDILNKYNVKVTFFMTGDWVESFPKDVAYIASQGHELGNHSENHKTMSQLNDEEIRNEIQTVHDNVKTLTGVDMTLFRPPYGDYNNEVVTVPLEMGYYCIQWDVDSLDWKDYGTESIIDTVLENPHLGNGSIILMHNGAKYTPAALEAIICGLQAKGYELVPVSQLIYKNDYHIDHEGRQAAD